MLRYAIVICFLDYSLRYYAFCLRMMNFILWIALRESAIRLVMTKNFYLDSRESKRGSILDKKSGLQSCEQGHRTNCPLPKSQMAYLPDLSLKDKYTNYLNCPLISLTHFSMRVGVKSLWLSSSMASPKNSPPLTPFDSLKS